MELVTANEIVTPINTNQITITKEEIEYYTCGLCDFIPLDSDGVVLAGLFPLEICHKKFNKLPHAKLNLNKIQVYLFGTQTQIKENFLKIITNIHLVYGAHTTNTIFGIEYRERVNDSGYLYDEYYFEKYNKIIEIHMVNSLSVSGVLDQMNSANEMCYWSNSTGFVQSIYSQLAVQNNQVMINPRGNQMVLTETLYLLGTIGFKSDQYLKTNMFTNDYPKSYGYGVDKIYGSLNVNKLFINSRLINPIKPKNFTNLNDLNLIIRTFDFNTGMICNRVGDNDYNSIALNGKIKENYTKGLKNAIIFLISDYDVAKKVLNIIKFGMENLRNESKTCLCIMETNFLSQDEKTTLNSLGSYKEIYSNENTLGIICNSLSKSFIDKQLPLNQEITIWVRFNLHNNSNCLNCICDFAQIY